MFSNFYFLEIGKGTIAHRTVRFEKQDEFKCSSPIKKNWNSMSVEELRLLFEPMSCGNNVRSSGFYGEMEDDAIGIEDAIDESPVEMKKIEDDAIDIEDAFDESPIEMEKDIAEKLSITGSTKTKEYFISSSANSDILKNFERMEERSSFLINDQTGDIIVEEYMLNFDITFHDMEYSFFEENREGVVDSLYNQLGLGNIEGARIICGETQNKCTYLKNWSLILRAKCNNGIVGGVIKNCLVMGDKVCSSLGWVINVRIPLQVGKYSFKKTNLTFQKIVEHKEKKVLSNPSEKERKKEQLSEMLITPVEENGRVVKVLRYIPLLATSSIRWVVEKCGEKRMIKKIMELEDKTASDIYERYKDDEKYPVFPVKTFTLISDDGELRELVQKLGKFKMSKLECEVKYVHIDMPSDTDYSKDKLRKCIGVVENVLEGTVVSYWFMVVFVFSRINKPELKYHLPRFKVEINFGGN